MNSKSKIFVCGLLTIAFLCGFSSSAPAQQTEQENTAVEQGGDATEQEGMTPDEFIKSLNFHDGHIEIPEANASLTLDPQFRYLEKADARRVLEDWWENPVNESVLGLIVPRHPSIIEKGTWAVMVTYFDEGYIPDDDASKIDYDDLLSAMKNEVDEQNEVRRSHGIETVQLIGWAAPPHYDATNKKLHWAKELKFGDEQGTILNYDIRVLGRHGYLSLNAISSMSDMESVSKGMQQLLPMVSFNQGARYADHNPSTDKIASYGLAALIGGGLAAKAGLLAKLGLLFAKLWKVIAIGLIFLGFVLKKILSSRKGRQDAAQ